jgi:hypothetical protein
MTLLAQIHKPLAQRLHGESVHSQDRRRFVQQADDDFDDGRLNFLHALDIGDRKFLHSF